MRCAWATVLATVALAGGAAAAAGAGGPTLAPATQKAVPRAVVTLRGSGFPPSDALVLTFDDAAVGQLSSDTAGAFVTSLTVPADASAGPHALRVADAAGIQAEATLEVVPEPPQVVNASFASRGLGGPLQMSIYLPSGYSAGAKRYPVIYFLHGLPATDVSYQSWTSFVTQSMSRFPSAAIVVVPQAARSNDVDPEFQDWGEAREWETAIAVELPAWIDSHYRTIADRSGRALVGVSAGGYGALIVGLHHLAAYSVLESWSGYFAPTDPAGRKRLDLGSPQKNAWAAAETFIPSLQSRVQPTFLGFYVGRDDRLFRRDNVRFHRRLVAASVPHTFGLYPGGHVTALWASEAPLWLGLALRHLAAPG